MNKWIIVVFVIALIIIQSIVVVFYEINRKPPEKIDIAIHAEVENTKERMVIISQNFKEVLIPVMHLKGMLSEKSKLKPVVEKWVNNLGAMLLELSRIHAETEEIEKIVAKNQKQDEKKLINLLKNNGPILDSIEAGLIKIKMEIAQEKEKIDKKPKGKSIKFTPTLKKSQS